MKKKNCGQTRTRRIRICSEDWKWKKKNKKMWENDVRNEERLWEGRLKEGENI